MTEVPDVCGLDLAQARVQMAQQGFRVLDDGGSGTVTAQMPSAGASLPQSGQVMLYTYSQNLPTPEQLVCVPDVAGQSMAQAATLLRQRELDMEISGTGYAVRQEPAAGSYALRNTVVKVEFAMPNP